MRLTLHQTHLALDRGSVVAIPTETVYGLAARIDRPGAIDEIYTLKKRPRANPLIVHVATFEQILSFLDPDFQQMQALELLCARFWPGPLTVILPVKPQKLSRGIRAELPTAGFRIPAHPIAQKLLGSTGPLVAPSANLSGSPSATRAEHVENDFGRQFPVLDGGPCNGGIESTILKWQKGRWAILRPGSILPKAVQMALADGGIGQEVITATSIDPSPGSQFRHYAPRAALCFDLSKITGSVAILGFDDRQYKRCDRLFSLGSTNQPTVASRRLYAALRELDICGVNRAFVDLDLPDEGLWVCIKERLLRAGGQI